MLLFKDYSFNKNIKILGKYERDGRLFAVININVTHSVAITKIVELDNKDNIIDDL